MSGLTRKQVVLVTLLLSIQIPQDWKATLPPWGTRVIWVVPDARDWASKVKLQVGRWLTMRHLQRTGCSQRRSCWRQQGGMTCLCEIRLRRMSLHAQKRPCRTHLQGSLRCISHSPASEPRLSHAMAVCGVSVWIWPLAAAPAFAVGGGGQGKGAYEPVHVRPKAQDWL